jgi:hypothetical protein
MDIKELLLHLKVNSSQVEYGYAFDDWELLDNAANIISQQADRIAELEFENKAFRDELFKKGSMDSCSQAAALHGFVSPRQAGDDAREYIANVLKKASEK